MAKEELIIDEEYLAKLQDGLDKSVNSTDFGIEQRIEDYVKILKKIRETAILDGDIASALDSFIECAEKLKGIADEVTTDIRELIEYYQYEIDVQDKYLF